MNHLTALQLSMLADGALTAEDSDAHREHLGVCDDCRARLASLEGEQQVLKSALQAQSDAVPVDIPKPQFARSATLRGFALANVVTGLVIWGAQFLWKSIFGELVMNTTTWLTSIYLPDVYEMTRSTLVFLLDEGAAMLDAYLGLIVACAVTVVMLWLAFMFRRTRASLSVSLLVLIVGASLLPLSGHALELRTGEAMMSVPASETIDDTLIIAGERIVIAGNVTGDVLATGRTIEVSGTIGGNLVTFGETMELSGKVGGMALAGVSSYDVEGGQIGGDLWVGGETVKVEADSSVGRNLTFAGRLSTVDGSVGKDVYAFGETAEINGTVGSVQFFGNRVYLLDNAHVLGDVRIRSGNPESLEQADSARVEGQVEYLDLPEELVERSPYLTIGFYLGQLAYFAGAFLVGFILLWLAPGLRDVSIGAGVEGAKTAGIGLVGLISIPVVAVLIAITLIGIPISLIAIAAWLLGWYLAKIVVAVVIGEMLMGESDNRLLVLLVGLGVVMVAINLPFIGGILSFLLTIVGFGLLVQYLLGAVSTHRDDEFEAV